MVKRLSFLSLFSLCVLCISQCGIEPLLFNGISSNVPSDPGSVENRFLAGVTNIFTSGTADLISSTGESVAIKTGNIEQDGKFVIEVSSKIDLNNVIILLKSGNRVLLDIYPRLTRADSIAMSRDDAFRLKVVDGQIDERSTAFTILVIEKLRKSSSSLSQVSYCAVKNARGEVYSKFESDSESHKLLTMVAKIISSGSESDGNYLMFDVVSYLKDSSRKSILSEEFLKNNEVNYSDGDNKSVLPFEEQIEKSASEFEFVAKYDETRLTTVITANINEGLLDGNGNTINPFKWATKKDGAKMYIALGIHKDSPIQDEKLNQEVFKNWKPNVVQMYDDGTNGDEIAGDNIWTISFVLPKGLRIGYKFTYGLAGDIWTGTEEWPGNQRLLEIVDVNGDHFVTRYDSFGDETTNKDKANQLLPSRGGTGTVNWDTDADKDGIKDAQERQQDSKGNKLPISGWKVPSKVFPATIDECE
ncbi:MAG: choice-of-anchor X domain-containing protein [Myxococcota bacterium]